MIKITNEERFKRDYNFYKNDIVENFSELYEFINFEYILNKGKGTNQSFITVKHKVCGNIFTRRACAWKKNKNCLHCALNRSVSLLHSSMCYYGKKIYPDSEFEYDIGFTGDSGGKSRYDLFVPNYDGADTIFEFQSRFHDYKTDFDKRKKKFAEDNGYVVICIDSRDISPLDALYRYYKIKISQKELQEIFLFNKNYDMKKVQELLDKNITVKEISRIMNISENIIHHNIKSKNLLLLENRKETTHGKTKVVQLDLFGNFIKEFDSGWQVYKELGFKVDSCISGKTRHAHGFLFIKKEKYVSGKYIIPNKIRLFNNG